MTAALLAMTTVLVAASATLFAASLRRRNPFAALAGMTVMIVAGIAGAVYASVSG